MRTRGVILLIAGLLATACEGPRPIEPPVTSTFHDPPGDTLNRPDEGTPYDITQVRTERTSANLSVRVTFVQGIRLPSPGADARDGTQLSGALELDTDRDPNTGNPSLCPTSAGRQTIGVDRYVLLNRRNFNGTYNVVDASGRKTGEADVSVSGITSNVLVLSVDRSALGNTHTNLVVIAGNGRGGPSEFTATDCAPDRGGAVVTRVQVTLPGMR